MQPVVSQAINKPTGAAKPIERVSESMAAAAKKEIEGSTKRPVQSSDMDVIPISDRNP